MCVHGPAHVDGCLDVCSRERPLRSLFSACVWICLFPSAASPSRQESCGCTLECRPSWPCAGTGFLCQGVSRAIETAFRFVAAWRVAAALRVVATWRDHTRSVNAGTCASRSQSIPETRAEHPAQGSPRQPCTATLWRYRVSPDHREPSSPGAECLRRRECLRRGQRKERSPRDCALWLLSRRLSAGFSGPTSPRLCCSNQVYIYIVYIYIHRFRHAHYSLLHELNTRHKVAHGNLVPVSRQSRSLGTQFSRCRVPSA